jgi:mono/diheme cytochrome c family protein
MHSVDVDLTYTPRNGSTASTALSLWDNLDEGGQTFANRLPVAEFEEGGADPDDATYSGGDAGDATDDDEVTCLTCHRAHGSEAAMAGNARIGVKTRLGITTQGRNAAEDMDDSVLLRIPNRGVCETCHNMPIGY